MARRAQHLLSRAFFHKAAKIHDRHAIRDMAHHAKIMAHQYKGQAQIADQIAQQIDHLRLH